MRILDLLEKEKEKELALKKAQEAKEAALKRAQETIDALTPSIIKQLYDSARKKFLSLSNFSCYLPGPFSSSYSEEKNLVGKIDLWVESRRLRKPKLRCYAILGPNPMIASLDESDLLFFASLLTYLSQDSFLVLRNEIKKSLSQIIILENCQKTIERLEPQVIQLIDEKGSWTLEDSLFSYRGDRFFKLKVTVSRSLFSRRPYLRVNYGPHTEKDPFFLAEFLTWLMERGA